jgi:EAL domain-containing protein (putative c-di-GMP-specific phosphodiesterase class I)/GGDEF domain-containing protein
MKRVFIDRKESHLIVTRIEALGSFARERGHTTADKLVKDFAQTLRKSAAEFDPGSILPFRMIGAKFVVVLRGDKLFTEKYCQRVGEQLGVLCEKYELKDLAHMGIVPIDLFSTTNAAMDFANEAYEKARIIGPNSVAYEEAKEGVRNMDQWRALLTEVIDQVRFKVVLLMGARGVKKENLGEMVLEEATSQAIDNSGDPIPIGTFVSLAESFGMAMSFDKAVVNKILQVIRQEKITHDVTINLSLTSISDIGFQDWLRETIGGNDDLKGQLVFAVTAYSATKNLPTFKIFIDFVHSMGCKILLKRFEPTLLPMKDLKNYRLDYIRLARSYTQGISTDEQKRNLVQSMGELGDLIDVKVLAEGVEDEDDYEIITQSGLFAASR